MNFKVHAKPFIPLPAIEPKAEEAALWNQLRYSGAAKEPDGLSIVRYQMKKFKFSLKKEILSTNTYCIQSVRTSSTSIGFEDFRLYYRIGQTLPYKIYINGRKFSVIEKYDLEDNCKTIIRNCMSHSKRKCYKQTFNYKKKERTLEVYDMDTYEIIHKEVLCGDYWLEDEFKYRD